MQCFADRVMKELRRHPPSVMKDPRMPLAMGLWREHLPDLVCLIVYRDPGDNVRSLLSSVKGGACQTCFPVVCVHLLLSHALVNSTSCSCDYAQFHAWNIQQGPLHACDTSRCGHMTSCVCIYPSHPQRSAIYRSSTKYWAA